MKPWVKFIFLLLLPIIFAGYVAGEEFPFKSKGMLEFWVDGASFASDSGLTWQELYWSFKAGDFASQDTLGRKMARFRTVILLKDEKGKLFLNEGWNTVSPMPSDQTLKQKDMIMVDQIEARRLTPGKYRLIMTITDLINNKNGTVDTLINIPEYKTISISQVELSAGISPDSSGERFKKASLTVRPCPNRVFDEEVYYYYECYNLPAVQDTNNKIFLRVSFSSDKDPGLKVVSNKDISKSNGKFSDYGGFKATDLSEGIYKLKVQIIDSSGLLAAAYANFEVNHPILKALAEREKIEKEITAMLQDGGEYYGRIEYIANKQQTDLLNKLDETGKKELLRRFWKQRDPNPDTPENEALIEHAQRYKFADDNFTESFAGGLKGSQTDRGRIYIKYGPWDDRDLTTDALQSKPMDIWTYDNGRQFMFVDKAGFNKYELVYSKTSEEKSDPRYQNYKSNF